MKMRKSTNTVYKCVYQEINKHGDEEIKKRSQQNMRMREPTNTVDKCEYEEIKKRSNKT